MNNNYYTPTPIPPQKPNTGIIIAISIASVVALAMIGIAVYLLMQSMGQKGGNVAPPSPTITSHVTTEPSPSETVQQKIYPPPVFERVQASGVTQSSSDSKDYNPYLIQDGRPDTAWNVAGGVGEWITISTDSPQKVNGIRILNGYTKYNPDYGFWVYYRNNRAKDITVSFSDGKSITKTLNDYFDESNYHYQEISLDEPVITTYIKFTINSIYKGDRWDDTCISEVQVY